MTVRSKVLTLLVVIVHLLSFTRTQIIQLKDVTPPCCFSSILVTHVYPSVVEKPPPLNLFAHPVWFTGKSLDGEHAVSSGVSIALSERLNNSRVSSVLLENVFYTTHTEKPSADATSVVAFIILTHSDYVRVSRMEIPLADIVCREPLPALASVRYLSFSSAWAPQISYGVFPLTTSPGSVAFQLHFPTMYTAVLISCSSIVDRPQLHGRLYFKNYFGYLSEVDAPKLSSYAIGFSLVFILFIVCLIAYFRKRIHYGTIHLCVLLLIFAYLVTLVLFYCFYVLWTIAGTPNSKIYVLALCFQSMTMAFFYVLFISVLYGGSSLVHSPKNVNIYHLLHFFITFSVLDTVRYALHANKDATYSSLPMYISNASVLLLHLIAWISIYVAYYNTRKRTQLHQTFAYHDNLLIHFVTSEYLLLLSTFLLFITRICFSRVVLIEKHRYEFLLYDLSPIFLFTFSLIFLSLYVFRLVGTEI